MLLKVNCKKSLDTSRLNPDPIGSSDKVKRLVGSGVKMVLDHKLIACLDHSLTPKTTSEL